MQTSPSRNTTGGMNGKPKLDGMGLISLHMVYLYFLHGQQRGTLLRSGRRWNTRTFIFVSLILSAHKNSSSQLISNHTFQLAYVHFCDWDRSRAQLLMSVQSGARGEKTWSVSRQFRNKQVHVSNGNQYCQQCGLFLGICFFLIYQLSFDLCQ